MKKSCILYPIILLCLTSCQQSSKRGHVLPFSANERSIYYWRTTFSLNDYETDFLKKQKIKRLYIRLFDVDINRDTLSNEKCIPVGTINFKSPIPSVEIVPVVFITPEAIRHHEEFTKDLARRVYAMCQYHNINVNEVQFDCDWTASTRESYFQFIKNVQAELLQYYPSVVISATIRLHQLAQAPPEVAYGTLMCYNTGDFKDFSIRNAILDIEDVRPYLKYLKDYPLPLTLALPDYEWNVEFSADQDFMCLNRHSFDFSDKQQFQKTDRKNVFQQLKDGQAYKYIRHESVSYKELSSIKKAVRKAYNRDMPVTLYHLDSAQLTKYKDNEIEKIFR
jgi:hypothetical protein